MRLLSHRACAMRVRNSSHVPKIAPHGKINCISPSSSRISPIKVHDSHLVLLSGYLQHIWPRQIPSPKQFPVSCKKQKHHYNHQQSELSSIIGINLSPAMFFMVITHTVLSWTMCLLINSSVCFSTFFVAFETVT